jgi:hypothetical protein
MQTIPNKIDKYTPKKNWILLVVVFEAYLTIRRTDGSRGHADMVRVLAILLFAVATASSWVNVTVYRTTPINYTGLTNMDSGDARGDVMFGMSQLLLPQLCAVEPSFLWCQNRQYLSGGSAHMVYSEFAVEADSRFGDYAPCNPNKTTGKFECMQFGSGRKNPPTCDKHYFVYFMDCLNGTAYKTLPHATQAECCGNCTADGSKCKAWNMPKADEPGCELLTDPLVQWDGGQSLGGCLAGEKLDPNGGFSPDKCWYDEIQFNTTFASVCDRKTCKCHAVEVLAMGKEDHAMCYHHTSSTQKKTAQQRAMSLRSLAAPGVSYNPTGSARHTLTAPPASSSNASSTATEGYILVYTIHHAPCTMHHTPHTTHHTPYTNIG